MTVFALFGPGHLAALATVAAVAAAAVVEARRAPRRAQLVRWSLAAALVSSQLGTVIIGRSVGAPWGDLLPLHFCDATLFVAAWALVTLRQAACEVSYFWSVGSLFALATPDLSSGPPDPMFFLYFAVHGGVVAAGLVLPFGLARRPRAAAARNAFLLANAYALSVLLVDLAFFQNFLYLLAKPAAPTLLDWLGPWPVYLAVCELAAFGLFWLLALPFREARRPT